MGCAVEELPFAPTSLTGILADLVFVLILAGGPMMLRWFQGVQTAAVAYYRAHTTAGERAVLTGLAEDAAAWAEHCAKSPEAAAKLKEAVTIVQAALQRRGIDVNAAEVEAAVAAALHKLQNPGTPAAS